MVQRFEEFLSALAEKRRVLLLGGLAVIAHGRHRPTKDADAWLEPLASSEEWSALVLETMTLFNGVGLFSLADREPVSSGQLQGVIEDVNVIRLTGLNPDLDLFRVPNNLEADQFDEVWQQAEPWTGGVRVMSAVDLLVTKADTGRPQDEQDIAFLENKIRLDFGQRLKAATPTEAEAILARYADHHVLAMGLKNPNSAVQEMSATILKQLAADEDPYAIKILREHGKQI